LENGCKPEEIICKVNVQIGNHCPPGELAIALNVALDAGKARFVRMIKQGTNSSA
jgi:tRNA A37 threonylcarbamoyladenosine biosynthesis protein TsaE